MVAGTGQVDTGQGYISSHLTTHGDVCLLMCMG
jgi:hypothetical protein